MNVKHLAAALVAALATTVAVAQAVPAAGVTREQVRAELAQAQADGTLPLSEASFLPDQFAAATASRKVAVAPSPRDPAAAEPIRQARR
jgi:hypothetical protein